MHKNPVRHPILLIFFASPIWMAMFIFFSAPGMLEFELGKFQWERRQHFQTKQKGSWKRNQKLQSLKRYGNFNPDISIWHNDLCNNNNEWIGFWHDM